MIVNYIIAALLFLLALLIIYRIKEYLKFNYEDELIDLCIKDFIKLYQSIYKCNNKKDLNEWSKEMELYKIVYLNQVPRDLLIMHLDKLDELYKEKLLKLA